MKRGMKKTAAACCIVLMLLSGCGKTLGTVNTNTDVSAASEQSDSSTTADNSQSAADVDSMFTDRDKEVGYDEDECIAITLSDDGSSCDSSSVAVEGQTITITEEGTYLLSGSLSDGMIVIDTDENVKVRLILNGVTINNNSSAAIYVKSADKVFVTLAPDSDNILSNGGTYEAIDDNNIDSVIFSKSDLTLNGSGSLTITAAAGHGIVSKDFVGILRRIHCVNLYITVDFSHKACQCLSWTDFNKSIHTIRNHPLHRSLPSDGRGYLFCQQGSCLMNVCDIFRRYIGDIRNFQF